MKLTLEGNEVQKYFDCEENYNQLEVERDELLGLVDDLSAEVKELKANMSASKGEGLSPRLRRDLQIAKEADEGFVDSPFNKNVTKPKEEPVVVTGRWSKDSLKYIKDVIYKSGTYSGEARSISTVAARTGRSHDSVIAKVYSLGGKVSNNKIKIPGV